MLGGAWMAALWPRAPTPVPTNFAWSFFFSFYLFPFVLPSLLLSLCLGGYGGGSACWLGVSLLKPDVVAVVAVSPPEHDWICVVVSFPGLGLAMALLHRRNHHGRCGQRIQGDHIF